MVFHSTSCAPASSRRQSLYAFLALLLLTACLPAAGQSILGGCLYSLDPSAQQAFFITGNTSVSAGCSIVVESSNGSAFVIGGTETLDLGNHAKVGVVGGWQLNGNSIVDTMSSQQEQPVTIANLGDPLASVVAPTAGTIVSAAPVTYGQSNPPPNNTLSPGVYCGGLSIGNPGGVEYTMTPGTYIMAGGGFSVTSSADVVGSGVTIYNTSSGGRGCSSGYSYKPISIDGQAKINLSAPTSGPLIGVVIFGDRNGCTTPGSCIDNINGQATATFTGNLYFPSDQLIFNGSSTTGGCIGVVADTITINGHSNFGGQACSINPIAVTVTPATTALYGGQQQQFSAAVTNTYNTAVTWSISPSVGSIDANGSYTAPATISTEQTVTVTATSQANPNASGSATITLFPPVTVAVSPATALLYQRQTQQFSATVGNAINTSVTWTISPAGEGTVDGNGLYTAPAVISNQQTAIITATSVVDTSKSASATITLTPPIAVSLSPVSATLYGGQTQQFTPTVISTSNTAVTWSVSPAGVGSLDGNGNYTAPTTIATQQTLIVTATSVADPTKSASASITLMPPITVSVSPATMTLDGRQTEQFSVSVLNTSNSAVTWSISPAGTGTISASGLYTAPATISSQQAVTITATSQADPTRSASATITLAPPACTPNGYSYVRAIVIDHTKVPNTDQVNFPFLFNTTDPSLATTANGGHVTNSNGYDIVFSTDPAGTHLLNYEMEEYNPATGQVIAWVNLPTLSHSSDTVLYILYGNPAITTSQQGPTKVWDANYEGVWHVPNGSVLSLADSTSNGNNVTNNGATAAPGQIDGGMQANGSTYATIGTPGSLANLAQGTATFSAWVKPAPTGGGVIMGKDDDDITAGWVLDLTYNNKVDFRSIYSYSDLDVQSSSSVSAGVWSHIVVTLSGSPSQGGTATIYINGVPNGSGTGGIGTNADDSEQDAYLASANYGSEGWGTLNGVADEFRISNVIRSSDWIATEYNSQNSPTTFYHLSAENVAISPNSTTLYGAQTQQFTATVLNGCTNSVSWTLEPAGLGTISASGLYTAPSTIDTPQTVTVTATSQADPTKSASVMVNLLPPIVVAVSPANTTLSDGGQQKFTANITNSSNSAVTWSVNPAGAGTIDANGLYSAPSGFTTQQTVTVTATSEADITKSASATITLIPPTLPPPVCAS